MGVEGAVGGLGEGFREIGLLGRLVREAAQYVDHGARGHGEAVNILFDHLVRI